MTATLESEEEVKKTALKTARKQLTFDELCTVSVDVKGTLNSRPLTYEYKELEKEVLTLSHLIFGRRSKSIPNDHKKVRVAV